ncbi:MAG TPA: hypothetical protein PKV72_00030 [Candidatus Peribacteria bacterium]|nr:hypothetical protein [Candidatus Peribacteria bacterium]
MRRRFLLIPALLLLCLPTSSSSAPLKPVMNEPEAYHDIRFGVDEVKSNIQSVMCGGWDPDSKVKIEYDPSIIPPPHVQIDCQGGINSCDGTTGHADLKQGDGTIYLCMSLAVPSGNGTEYLLMHELTHALQITPMPPGEPPAGGCCNIETQAYLVQCQAMADDGVFDLPQFQSTGLNVQTCAQFGVQNVSCPGQGCYPGLDPSLGPLYMAAITAMPSPSCEELKNNPTPRVKAIMDAIKALANSMQHLYVLKCDDGSQDCIPIPDVSPDMPGRQNEEPISKEETGIGVRGNFVYPDTALGYTSACNVYQTKYTDEDLKDRGIAYGLEDDDEDRDPNTGKPLTNPGDVEVNQEQLCIRYANATPHQCKKLQARYRTLSDNAPRPVMSCHTTDDDEVDADGNPYTLHYAYNFVKTYCFDYNDQGTRAPLTVNYLQVGLFSGDEAQVPGPFMPPENTKVCEGQECRTPWLPRFIDKFPENCDYDHTNGQMNNQPTHEVLLSSYFRHYAGPSVYSEADDMWYNAGINIREVKHGDTIQEWKLRTECYEYYDIDQGGSPNGEDWKPLVSTLFDEKCEIVIATKDCGGDHCTEVDPYQQEPLKPEWKNGDHIAGNYNTQKENFMPEVPLDEPQRGGRTAPDAWVYDPRSPLTMLDNRRVQKVQRLFEDPSDPSGFLDTMLESKVRGGKTVPDNARTDGFDDTAEREFTKWWEKQQKALLSLIQDPTVKLIMPARILVGLSDDDPLIKQAAGIISQPNGTVAVTLRAGPEELGTVLQSFQELYIAPIREVRIPIVVMQVSKAELQTRRAEWKLWKLRNPSIASQADPLIGKIDDYLDALERVRLMRLALAGRLQKMYEKQEEIRNFFGDWYVQNSQILLDAAQASLERQQLKTIWRKTQKAMLQADACQITWCSNQRFSADVYTLLDNWWRQKVMPGEAPPGRDRDGLPEPPDLTSLVSHFPDHQYDFSYMGLSKNQWPVPALWPVSVQIKIPLPPTYKGSSPEDVSKFPDLPEYPDITAFDNLTLPDVSFPDQTFIDPVPLPALGEAKDKLMLIREMIEGIPVDAQRQEEQEEQSGNSSAESGTDNFPTYRDSMRGTLCRMAPSVMTPTSKREEVEQDKDYGTPIKIIHTETDLVERMGRIWSRWMPERKEDYAGRIIRVGEEYPDPEDPPPCKEDVVCIHLPTDIFKSWKWQWFVPKLEAGLTDIAYQMRDLTLPPNENENPFLEANVELLKRLFPNMTLPMDIKLEPPAPNP